MGNEVIETRISRKWLDEDGILRIIMLPKVAVTLPDVKADMATYEQATGGKKCPVLVDIRDLKSMDREARAFGSANGPEHLLAAALLISSPVSRVIGNLFLGLNRPSIPIRLFTSEVEAVEWSKNFVS